jgi:hypothetical protein
MKRIVVLTIVLIPLLASAAHIFIWNYDPLDRFYETAIADSVDCAYWVE